MLTDNPVLVNKHRELPTIICEQKKAPKMIPTEEDAVRANIASFGNDIGKITNRTTSMYEIQSKYSPDDEEYKVLDYRIMCGQLIQQDTIDKSKGIISKPMPRTWYDRHSLSTIDDDDRRKLYKNIVADKKPYFMKYIYPALAKQYSTYIRNTDRNALREFGMTVSELLATPAANLTDRQMEFLHYYRVCMPVGTGGCVMNKICGKIENMFDGYVGKHSGVCFDYTIMKSGVDYSAAQASSIKKLYDEYNRRMKSYAVFTQYEKTDGDEVSSTLASLRDEFRRECEAVCQNEKELCDILLDICYTHSSSKRFVWDMCGGVIIDNLLSKNDYLISAPVKDPDGDIVYCGERFKMVEKCVGGFNEYCSE